MIDVQHTFRKNSLERVLLCLRDLPEHLSPTYFGYDEGKYSLLDRVDSELRFKEFIKDAESGFFLYAEKKFYGFLFDLLTFRVSIFDVEIEDGLVIFQALAGGGSIFGFAASGDEYEHRNLLRVAHENGTSEAWVGRDVSKYVPGLYWRTWLANQYLLERGLQHDVLRRSSVEVLEKVDGYEYCFFPNPDLWPQNLERLDRLCRETRNIFSASVVREDFERARGIQERMRVVKAWP